MEGKLIHLRLTEKLYSQIQQAAEEFGFQSVADFLRDSARKSLEEYEKKQAIQRLKALQGSMKGKIKRLTKAERRKLFTEYMKKDPSEIFRKYGLENIPEA